jgi:hypothetical protein
MGKHFCLELIFYKPMGAKNFLHEIFNKFGLIKEGWLHGFIIDINLPTNAAGQITTERMR